MGNKIHYLHAGKGIGQNLDHDVAGKQGDPFCIQVECKRAGQEAMADGMIDGSAADDTKAAVLLVELIQSALLCIKIPLSKPP
ncbi:hypothetical protein J2S00_003213 [Caldalkalibacillus uzonensis]|uniref:Uncharacterized protein n=1 Tax=Caldalkalibacillus uzonensis TaxID=353224 RepID=A0ABU0CVE2_9BACI|nr:hypothetical protein [Caldalkalibacillus uzonensis]MDQ0340404.1 hypothetical protein [Caldalkalibacillus uzonensis]